MSQIWVCAEGQNIPNNLLKSKKHNVSRFLLMRPSDLRWRFLKKVCNEGEKRPRKFAIYSQNKRSAAKMSGLNPIGFLVIVGSGFSHHPFYFWNLLIILHGEREEHQAGRGKQQQAITAHVSEKKGQEFNCSEEQQNKKSKQFSCGWQQRQQHIPTAKEDGRGWGW